MGSGGSSVSVAEDLWSSAGKSSLLAAGTALHTPRPWTAVPFQPYREEMTLATSCFRAFSSTASHAGKNCLLIGATGDLGGITLCSGEVGRLRLPAFSTKAGHNYTTSEAQCAGKGVYQRRSPDWPYYTFPPRKRTTLKYSPALAVFGHKSVATPTRRGGTLLCIFSSHAFFASSYVCVSTKLPPRIDDPCDHPLD